jgi:hypothetical protein
MKFKRNIELFKEILQAEFHLKSEPKILVKNRLKLDGELCFGLYYGDDIGKRPKHKILISREENKTLKTLFNTVAHEYIHCWQLEKGLECNHCEQTEFRLWREYFISKYQIDVIGLE